MTIEIALPGEPAPANPEINQAQQRRKPGPKSRADREAEAASAKAENGRDDLDDYESDELPPAPGVAMPASQAAGFSPAQQALIATMISDAVRAAKSGQDARTAANLAAGVHEKLPSQEEARVMSEAMIAKGIRPRGILTPDGWYIHPEAARVRDHGTVRLPLPE